MLKRIAAAMLAGLLLFAPSASATPVFDCTDPAVRHTYPAQCPVIGPGVGIGGGGAGGGGSCTGLCGIVRDVVRSIPGLGGLLG